jgi:hypothetical protein
VYFTLIPQHASRHFSLRVIRLDVATGRQTFIADGAQPATSGDGTQLAYGASPRGMAVWDLATGQTRTIGLAQLGRAATRVGRVRDKDKGPSHCDGRRRGGDLRGKRYHADPYMSRFFPVGGVAVARRERR